MKSFAVAIVAGLVAQAEAFWGTAHLLGKSSFLSHANCLLQLPDKLSLCSSRTIQKSSQPFSKNLSPSKSTMQT